MPVAAQKILPCLWFDTEAEEAAKFYCSIFKDSRIETISPTGTRDTRSMIESPARSWSWCSISKGKDSSA
jgi:predicted 3-demethylubiquinone-9 3-methyltransferase (glyoxalase superfamily)